MSNANVKELMLKVAMDLRSLADSVQAVYEAMQEDLPDKQPTAIEEKPAVEEKPSIWNRYEAFWLRKARQDTRQKSEPSSASTVQAA